MKIESGKRYVMRYGGITGVMQRGEDGGGSAWTDGYLTWHKDGNYFAGSADSWDLVAEYNPQPEPLPFELKAGERYETVKPDGTAGPITDELYVSVDVPRELIPFEFCDYWVGPTGLCAPNGNMPVLRIVRPYVEPKPPTPIERLEQWRSQYGVPSAAVPDLDAIIADLKATVRP